MALIGEMQYLTIGGSTYSIPTGTTVEVERNLTSGTKSATIKVDGTSYDLYAPTPNAGTVTSVRVQATSPVQSSTSTAQSSSLNTTISLANGYGDTKNPYGTKTKNYVLAGPTTGSDAAPTFRALVAADIPDLSNTYLTSYTETDPVFSASAAAGITSTDISNWNAKVSDTGKWNDVTLSHGTATGSANNFYLPALGNANNTTASLLVATQTPTNYAIAKYGSGAYLYSTTPSANDNSTKVATTAYVDAAIPDTSGFSTTDEKLKINAVSDTSVYYPIFGSNSTSAASTQLYDSNFKYQSATGATLTLGSLNGKMGSWQIFKGGYYINLQPATLTSARTIYLPDKGGTIALTSDIPTVSYPVTSVNNKTGAVSLSASDVGALPSTTVIPSKTSDLTNDSGFITSADIPEGASAYTGTISAVSTTASVGTNNGFARGDHVHNITKDTINGVLGTGSGTTKFYREDGTWATPAYTTNTDTKLQIAAVTSGTTYYPIVGANSTTAATRQYDATGIAYTGTNGTANGSNGNAILALGNSTASTTANWKKGTVRLYGTTAYYTDLVSGAPSSNRTITFPNATGTVALTSDIPTTLPASDVSAWAKAASKPTYTASEVGALASNTTYVSTVTTTAGTHSAITSKSGAVSFNVPTKTSHLTNDSGYVTSSGVTSVATGAGLTGGTITGTGTLKANLTSDTALSNAALSVTEDANRIYPVRIDKNSKLVVVVPWTNVNSSYLTGITSSQVTTALGYTPYNSTNPNGYTSNVGTVTQVTAGTGLSIGTTAQGNFTTTGTINHTNSITAGTAGTSSATSGATLAVPYITYDAQGHITATGTHTHTISGFLTSSSTLDATKLSGTVPSGCYTNTVTTATTTGSGNAVTAVTASNGALTITKGTTFQTNIVKTTTTITAANWNATTTATISVSGVTASNTVIVSPAPESINDWINSKVYCSAQASGTLTFTCTTTPTTTLNIVLAIMS